MMAVKNVGLHFAYSRFCSLAKGNLFCNCNNITLVNIPQL